jgi:hypothetical protein
VGFLLYLFQMRRWLSVAGIALAVIGALVHVLVLVWIALALIAIQVPLTILLARRANRSSRRRS